ncbi:hypothetical protein CLV40_104212 [Actinokineospora auranticolor]|uniref:Uncharacterized protein n=1 Tax=Actinokineospora auranticolor TaxID=155976 RepID=A0A2S6GUU9_9PSEU|nr:hypothetical protein CLV40_104212 [Actinokineospora auranticolor]
MGGNARCPVIGEQRTGTARTSGRSRRCPATGDHDDGTARIESRRSAECPATGERSRDLVRTDHARRSPPCPATGNRTARPVRTEIDRSPRCPATGERSRGLIRTEYPRRSPACLVTGERTGNPVRTDSNRSSAYPATGDHSPRPVRTETVRSARCPATGECGVDVPVHPSNRRSPRCVAAIGDPVPHTVRHVPRRSRRCLATGDLRHTTLGTVPHGTVHTDRSARCAAAIGSPLAPVHLTASALATALPGVPTGDWRNRHLEPRQRRCPSVSAIGETQRCCLLSELHPRPLRRPRPRGRGCGRRGCPSSRCRAETRRTGSSVPSRTTLAVCHEPRRNPCATTVSTVRPAPTVATPLRQAAPEWSTTLLGRVAEPIRAFAGPGVTPTEVPEIVIFRTSSTQGDRTHAVRIGANHFRRRAGGRFSNP